MAKELDAILDRGEAEAAASCLTENGSAKFLEKVICPIYETLADVSCFIDPQYNAVIYLIFVMREYSFNWFHIFLFIWVHTSVTYYSPFVMGKMPQPEATPS